MSFNIFNVEPKQIFVEENGEKVELTKMQVYKNGQRSTIWEPYYTLSITKGGYSKVTVGVKSSQYAIVNYVASNGSKIYRGSYLDITVNALEGYSVSWKLNGVTQTSNNVTVPVTGDVSISVTETATIVNLSPPDISGSFEFDSNGGFYYLICYIKNTNLCAVSANVMVYSAGDKLERSASLTIPANTTHTFGYGEMFSDGAKVHVTLSSSGYGNSDNFVTFGRYTGGSTDETSTTS